MRADHPRRIAVMLVAMVGIACTRPAALVVPPSPTQNTEIIMRAGRAAG
jgi:hypothetical protein